MALPADPVAQRRGATRCDPAPSHRRGRLRKTPQNPLSSSASSTNALTESLVRAKAASSPTIAAIWQPGYGVGSVGHRARAGPAASPASGPQERETREMRTPTKAIQAYPALGSALSAPLSVAGSVGPPEAAATPPIGESDTTTTTKPPEASSSRTQLETPRTMLQFSGVRGTAYDTSCGGATSRPGGGDTSVTQYWPGAGGVKTAKPCVASTVASTGASSPDGS